MVGVVSGINNLFPPVCNNKDIQSIRKGSAVVRGKKN
jgi:hypothetical protein